MYVCMICVYNCRGEGRKEKGVERKGRKREREIKLVSQGGDSNEDAQTEGRKDGQTSPKGDGLKGTTTLTTKGDM